MTRYTDFSIDPEARNPLYGGAMCLDEIEAGKPFASFNVRDGKVAIITPQSGWRLKEVALVYASDVDFPTNRKITSYLTLEVDDKSGHTIRLPDLGVHHFLEGDEQWHSHRFAVSGEQEPIVRFIFWLEKQYPRAAMQVHDKFGEFFDDNHFVDSIISQLQP